MAINLFSKTPLIKITPENEFVLKIKRHQTLSLNNGSDFIGGTPLPQENIDIENSDIVFVGYGINAPEYGWNDYEGLNVDGKTVLVLVNDLGYVTKDTGLFMGNAMTFYGRLMGTKKQPGKVTGAIIIHETAAASYPWGVVQNNGPVQGFTLQIIR